MTGTTKKSDRRVPPEQRKRTEHSCDRCKTRKQKCNRIPDQARCEHCERFNYKCAVTRPRKQRLYGSAEHVRARMVLLEALVKGLIPDADLSSFESMREVGESLGIPMPEIEEGEYHAPQPEPSQNNEVVRVEKKHQHLVQDQQGQGQYIGPASSYFFQLKLRTLLGRHQERICQMLLFGRNPTDESLRPSTIEVLTESEIRAVARPPQSYANGSSMSYIPALLDSSVIDGLVRAYFEHVNVDFPVLHEASFLENYDRWRFAPQAVDRAWVCTLLCVLILGRRINPLGTAETQQQKWWTHVESLLPSIIFTSSIQSIQALMLAALHLHNTNHRDVCWTLTGAAARIAVAIGLHRDDIVCEGPRLARELRRLLWWTLYSFEQIQVSSHDRPSALDGTMCSTSSPHERLLGIGSSLYPPNYTLWSTRLTSILGFACRALPTAASDPELTGLSGLLSPAAGLLRDLTRWHATLPQHLSLNVFDTLPDSFKRPVLLLHIQYHYTVSLLTRHSLMQHLGSLTQQSTSDGNEEEIELTAKVCCESGRKSCELLVQLHKCGKFNAVTWWDVYFVYSSTLVLALGLMWDRAQQRSDRTTIDSSLALLHSCATIVVNHSSNPMVPGTMRRWIGMICDLDVLVHEKLAPSHQLVQSVQRDVNAGSSAADAIVEVVPSMPTQTYAPIHDMGVVMQPSADLSVSHLDSALIVPNDGSSNPTMGMPFMNDEGGFYSWDSIGCMLLGTETMNAPMNCNMAFFTDTGH
ncbi:hypothetical protein ABZX51_002992 [Aspergillus tubingensis]